MGVLCKMGLATDKAFMVNRLEVRYKGREFAPFGARGRLESSISFTSTKKMRGETAHPKNTQLAVAKQVISTARIRVCEIKSVHFCRKQNTYSLHFGY